MTRYSITLDLTKYTTQLSVPCKNTDVGREIAITLHQNGVPYTLTADNYAVFVAKNSSGADIVNDCVVDLVNNCVVYKITQQTIANGGNIPCEIQLFGYDREQIGSPTFNILVRKSILGETDIESSDEYGTLNAIINDIRRSLEAGEFDGKSAYQYAVEYGYEGSEEEFGFILAEMKTYKEYTDQHLFDHDEAIHELQGANEQLYMIADEVDAKFAYHNKRLTNLEKGLPIDRFVTDGSAANIKTVPTNTCPYAAVAKVGGKTSKCTNLLPYPYVDSTATVQGVTFTDNGDGTITANGTPNENAVFWLTNNLQLSAGIYRIVLREAAEGDGILISIMKNGKWIYDTGSSYKIEIADGDIIRLYLQVPKGKTASHKTFMPRVNKGETVLPFESYYEGIRNAKVTAIESKDASCNIIGRIDIPTEVQNLDGYGEEGSLIEWRTDGVFFNGTDISDLITADNLIEVEGGGTLTFVNEYGAAVPSTILYQVKGE